MLFSGVPYLISHFWEFGEMAFLLPAFFVVATLLQLLLFREKKRPWLPAAVCAGILAICETTVRVIAAFTLGKFNLGIAFVAVILESFVTTVLLGFVIGLLAGLLWKKPAAAAEN